MATERITIENFKGISHLELDVKPFTVLIGPQSVGKSVTAKLLYYFQSINLELFQLAINDETSPEPKLLELFENYLPEPNRQDGITSITYAIGENCISLTHSGEPSSAWKLKLPKIQIDEFAKIRSEFSAAKKVQNEDDLSKITFQRSQIQQMFLKRRSEELRGNSVYNTRFIPAGRSFYAQVEKDMVSFFESATVDPFVSKFGKYLARLKGSKTSQTVVKASEFSQLAAQIAERLLSGSYYRESQKDYIKVSNGRKLSTILWSSGQQESLPLVFLLRMYIDRVMKPLHLSKTSLFIEEPEAHLFPTSQRSMVELIALAFNALNGSLNLFVTTHSPYVLSTANVLLKAGQLYDANPTGQALSKVSKIVPKSKALNPSKVGAYYMDARGCRSIIDPETGLIDGRAIDDVSAELAEQLDALSDVE